MAFVYRYPNGEAAYFDLVEKLKQIDLSDCAVVVSEFSAKVDDLVYVKFSVIADAYTVALKGYSIWATLKDAETVTLPELIEALTTDEHQKKFGVIEFSYERLAR